MLYKLDLEDELKNDEEIMKRLASIYQDSTGSNIILKHLGSELKNQPEFMLQMIQYLHVENFKYCSEELKRDIPFIKRAIQVGEPAQSSIGGYAGHELFGEFSVLSFLPEEIKENEELYTELKEWNDECRKKEKQQSQSKITVLQQEAKDAGYPESFEFYNNLDGTENLSYSYVIKLDGSVRTADCNSLKYWGDNRWDWKNRAEGTKSYKQIMPGEIIITYTKENRTKPYILDIAWADGKPTPEQLRTIIKELSNKVNFSVDIDGKTINSVEEWMNDKIEDKVKECRDQLPDNDTEKSQEEKFVEGIVESAIQRVNARNKNTQAKELAKKYEQQLQENPELEDSEYE